MNTDNAVALAIEALKTSTANAYGYDYYPFTVAQNLAAKETHDHREMEKLAREYYPFFEEAGWILSLRGVLRPGVRSLQAQASDAGGYSLTEAGNARLGELDAANALIYQSGALLDTFAGFVDKFGEGFLQRAAEAVQCRDTGSWLASCAMCGAAAEAVLLAIAIAKVRDEARVLAKYRGANGRREVTNLIAGQAKQHIKVQLIAFTGIISAWRDEASHGTATEISTANADEALRQLLHMCQWAVKEWASLTS